MSEFAGMIVREQDGDSVWGDKGDFRPLGAMLMNSMVTHGATKEDFEEATTRSTAPERVDDGPFFVFLLESERMMRVTDWGRKAAGRNDAKL